MGGDRNPSPAPDASRRAGTAVRALAPVRRLLHRDPLIDPRSQQRQRQRAVIEQGVVEAPEVERRPERRLGPRAQGPDLEFAELVAECLPGVGNVAIDLRLGEPRVQRGMVHDIDHPEYGKLVVMRSPIHYGGVKQPDYRPSGEMGADIDAIFINELGMKPDEVAELRKTGVV